jgi:pimeloyl-ACP methyl ester carboxylesterase
VGRGEPPLVLLHGWCDHGGSWDPVTERLARHYRCIAPDMRGHGESSVPIDHAFFLDALTGDVLALCAATGIVAPVLVGHSYGGLLAAEIARRFPGFARAAISVAPPLDVASQWAHAQAQGLDPFIRAPESHQEFRRALKSSLMPTGTPPAVVEHVLECAERTSIGVGLALWATIYERTAEELRAWDASLRAALAHLPSLSIQREAWPAADAALRSAAPEVEIRVVPGSHWLHLDDPDAFVEGVREFLGRV